MRYRKTEIWKSVDWITILLYLIMVIAGWFSICGASYEFDNVGLFDPSGRPGMQMIWIGTSLALIFVILMLESDFFDIFAYLIYACVIVLLIATIFLAPNIKGSHSWLVLGPIRLQPAELAKFATALAVAKFMNGYGFKLTTVKNFSITLFLIFLPMVCILLQKETGSALVYLAFFLMLYREGMTGYILLIGVCAVVFFVTGMKYSEVMVGITPLGELIVSCLVLLITMGLVGSVRKDYISVKIMLGGIASTFLIGYVVSLFVPVNFTWISIGLVGAASIYLFYLSIRNWVWHYALIALFALKGFLNGTQTKLKYVPEQDTDFIFCTVGEEQGFLGASAVLIVFGLFILRLIVLAERQDNAFGRVYGYSVASIFFFHLAINVGMVTGLTPVIGIPLPFFSYGGSSLWGFTILLFIFLRLDASRKER